MDRMPDETLLSLDQADASRSLLWDVDRDSHGHLRFTAYPAVQRAARNINFRQTVCILSFAAEFTLIVAFAVTISNYAQEELASDRIALRTAGILVAAVVIRQSLAAADAHPLNARHCSPLSAALSVAAAFTLLLLGEAYAGQKTFWQTSAWAVPSVASVLVLRTLVWRSGWALDGGGIALVGESTAVQELSSSLSRPRRRPVVALFDQEAPESLSTLRRMVEEGHVETVVLTAVPPQSLGATLNRLADLPAGIYMAPNFGPTYAPLPEVIEVVPNLLTGTSGLSKRFVDLVGASAALGILGPFLLLTALIVRLETPGPALFRQVRFGLGGRAVEVWKFRTMYLDRGDVTGEARTLARDPRVTPFGRILRRLSIDELPQLINVLRGEMSLVGPRPHATKMKIADRYYTEAVAEYPVRHRVKPGITGWAQVNGSRGEVDTMEKAVRRVELDLWYIANWTIWLDIQIILRTAAGGFVTLKAD
jgi:exopolysaccharide biosynthesis polyprenyl glycosylphosphotransferase